MPKSQIWSMDLIIGVSFFLIIMVIYFIFTNNLSGTTNFDDIYNSGVVASDTLLSGGNPISWEASNVEEPGITDGNHRLNITKLQILNTLEYDKLKTLLKTKYDYLIFFENKNGDVLTIGGVKYIGKYTKETIKNEEIGSLSTIKRLLIYNSDILIMVVYQWQ